MISQEFRDDDIGEKEAQLASDFSKLSRKMRRDPKKMSEYHQQRRPSKSTFNLLKELNNV